MLWFTVNCKYTKSSEILFNEHALMLKKERQTSLFAEILMIGFGQYESIYNSQNFQDHCFTLEKNY